MSRIDKLQAAVEACLGDAILDVTQAIGELTIELASDDIKASLTALRDAPGIQFDQLIDLCGVDYSEYAAHQDIEWHKPRYAVVYHLQSVALNRRMRVRTFVEGEPPLLDSVIDVWPVANWYEREAFDVMGIAFAGHPDLRRILTDYGFIGHPFRKDFPLSGHVEMRYDEEKGRVIYEPVTVEPRILVPRINRERHDQSQ